MSTVTHPQNEATANATGTHRWVRVKFDGAVLQQDGVVDVAHPAVGRYVVTFREPVTRGAWHATLVRTELQIGFDEPSAAHIALEPTRLDTQIEVLTWDEGKFAVWPSDSGFHLAVHS